MTDAEPIRTCEKLALITERARGDRGIRFTSLAHLLNEGYLRECFLSLNRNKAVGADNVSWWDYWKDLDENIRSLVERLKAQIYEPIPARRVYIPKNEKEKRPIGIPAIENKIVERGIVGILNKIYEEDFHNFSYGFRIKRSCHHALKRIHNVFGECPINHVVEADIKGFFDNVSHTLLMRYLGKRIADSSMLALIEKFLKAGYIDDGLLMSTEQGTPQGGILSPLLANIFLHYALDEWFVWIKGKMRGYCELVRYADDFVCLVQYQDEAKVLEDGIRDRLKSCGLEIHPDKSRRISFGRYERENAKRQGRKANTFDFLGITHFCDLSRKKNFKIGRQTARKKFKTKCREMKTWLKSIVNRGRAKDWWGTLKSKLIGHYQYYGVSENSKGLQAFYHATLDLVRKWLGRRSQKSAMSWPNFNRYLGKYPLPTPRIVHSFY